METTLNTLKNQYAQEQCYEDWLEFVASTDHLSNEWFEKHMNEICIRAQKAALAKAAENVTTVHNTNQSADEIESAIRYTMHSITNEENLIR